VDNAGTPNAAHVVLTYGYDAPGNETSVSDNYGGAAAYTFDNGGRMTSASLSTGGGTKVSLRWSDRNTFEGGANWANNEYILAGVGAFTRADGTAGTPDCRVAE